MGEVKTARGGYMRLEDFCNSGPVGCNLHFTSALILMEEELLVHELGERVALSVIDWECDRWDALLELRYKESENAEKL